MVASNTSPLNYLIQIGAVEVLERLYGELHVPQEVMEELSDPAAPDVVKRWVASPPFWLIIHKPLPAGGVEWPHLHRGEVAAIRLALSLRVELLLMDDLDGRHAARTAGVEIMGTLGILDAAAMKKLADFERLVTALQATNFRAPRKLVEALRLRHGG